MYECPIETTVNKFSGLLLESMEKSMPNRSKRRSKSGYKVFPRNAWFDKDCKQQKKVVNCLVKKLKNDYTNNDIKEAYWVQRNIYKKLLKVKKSAVIKRQHSTLLHLSTSNPRQYWQAINKAAGARRKCIPVELDAMAEYFMKLNECDETRKRYILPCIEDDILDITIDEEEVWGAINALKHNKAPGLDRLPPELFKMFNQELVGFLTSLYNIVYSSGIYPKCWSLGCIVPIYKKGDESDTANYRGITLLPIIGKIFTTILKRRILQWAETNDKFNGTQFGFRKNRRTMDPIFITNTVAEEAKRLKQPMFVAFIDFAKAFDSVHHQLLWMKLSALGFSTRMLKILQNMYLNASSVVMMDGCISTSFPCKIGVRQGCPLSPILFSLYISDLESQISCESTGFITILNQSISTLMFADDLALFADSPAGLQHSLIILEQFCHQWKLNRKC